MTEPESTPRASLGVRARAMVPRAVKDALKPIVRSVVPGGRGGGGGGGGGPPGASAQGDLRRHRVADNWVGNRWTIEVDGRTHKFLFVSGSYKSGTHWVMRVLNLHPDVNIKGEFHFETLWKGVQELTSVPWYLSSKEPASSVAQDSAQDLVRRVMYMQTRDKPNATWLGDRTPRALMELLPGAPNVAIRRDGRDVMVSWNFHHLRVSDPSRFMPRFRDMAVSMCPDFRANPSKYEHRGMGFLANEDWFRHHARVWRDTVLSQINDGPKLRAAGTPVLEIVYEEMHRDATGQSLRLYEFLGLNPELAAPLSEETMTLPGIKAPSPLKFLRKGAIGEWRDYYDERQSGWFKEEAGDALIATGYEKDSSW